ncbi:WD repeat-containing protein 81 isoform X1 [Hydra vulgaris]|uniref:WD repeat-containing protein 81 isoform X1 n=1 Tax=Hydra vulgaris TaxID=6087 RepID=UPI001F5EB521|nr:WD repeat-containing protein 81 [Hydra vulgaris]
MGQACTSQEAQEMLIADLNLPSRSVIKNDTIQTINKCLAVVSNKWISTINVTGRVHEDIELEKLKKDPSTLSELFKTTHRFNQSSILQKVNVYIIKKNISFTVSSISSAETDSIFDLLLTLLTKQKQKLSEYLSKYEHCKLIKQSSDFQYDWVTLSDLLFQVYGIRSINLNSNNQTESNTIYPNECSHLTKVISIIESTKTVYIIEEIPNFSLADGLAYSPAIAGKSYLKFMFLFQQLLEIFVFVKKFGFSFHTSLSLKDISLSHNALWISMSPIQCLSFDTKIVEPVLKKPLIRIYDGINTELHDEKIILNESLSTYTKAWVEGDLNNFDYLMILNKVSGRKFNDVLNHPVFPWVTDFLQQYSGFRDLTKTMFRLNKGDRMLDETYTSAYHDYAPHHISDFLSDITYYLYHARDTAKEVLCKHVRSRWVPNEYPVSMERMYQCTPDECIPEFFYNPSILVSIHNDLKDIVLPYWTANSNEFVKYHYEMLESPNVSKNLHHWIDLIFGYKLGDTAAKQDKNVHLSLVDDHTDLRNYGVVQLFFSPHPHKKISRDNMLSQSGSREDVSMSWEYVDISKEAIQQNAENESNDFLVEFSQEDLYKKFNVHKFKKVNFLTTLDHVEKILTHESNISAITEKGIGTYYFGSVFDDIKPDENFSNLDIDQSNLEEDEKLFLCLVIETLLYKELKTRTVIPTLDNRLKEDLCFLKASNRIANWMKLAIKDCIYPNMPMTSCSVMSSLLGIFSFPSYFKGLHKFLFEFYNFIDDCVTRDDKANLCLKLECYNTQLVELLNVLDPEGLDILVGYIFPLFHQKQLQIPMFLYIFPSLSKALGPTKSKNLFIRDLQRIYENMKMSEDVSLVQQSFLSKILDSFGQQCFLELLMNTLLDLLVIKDAKIESFTQSSFKSELFENYEVSPCYFGETDSIFSLNLGMFFNEDIVKNVDDSDGFFSENKFFSNFKEEVKQSKSECFDLNNEYNQVVSLQEKHLTRGHSSIIDVETNLVQNTDLATSVFTNEVQTDTVPNNNTTLYENAISESQKSFSLSFSDTIQENESSSFQLCQLEKDESIDNLNYHYDKCSIKSINKLTFTETVVESFFWLIPWLGPVLSIEYIASPLLKKLFRMQLELDDTTDPIDKFIQKISPILDCLVEVVVVYGENLITSLYIFSLTKLIQTALNSATISLSIGSNLVCSIQLMVESCKVLSPESVVSHFETLADHVFQPLIRLLSSLNIFVSGSMTKVYLSRKLIDILGILCQKINRELAQALMVPLLQQFFSCFDGIYYLETDSNQKKVIKRKNQNKTKSLSFNENDQFNNDKNKIESFNKSKLSFVSASDNLQDKTIFDERYEAVYETFSPALAYYAYVLISRIFSSVYVEKILFNSELVWFLCSKHDEDFHLAQSFNKSIINRALTSKWFQPISVVNPEDENYQKNRSVWQHIYGNWFNHWQRNIDDSKPQEFIFNDCKLQTYTGHSSPIRDMYVAENEHYFLSASRDKTVKLWLLKNHGNGTAQLGCTHTYDKHKKAVFSVQGIESKRLVSSCDGIVHVWDPIVATTLSVYDSSAGETVTCMHTLPSPSTCIGVASTDGLLRLYDVRQKKVAQCWKLSTQPNAGTVRCMCVSSRWIAAGFSNGLVSVVDIRCGILRKPPRVFDTEVTQLQTVPDRGFISLSADSCIRLWTEDGNVSQLLKPQNDFIHSVIYCNRQLLWGTTNNKINIHNPDKMSIYSTHRVTFKGSLIKMSVLPMNKLFLLATDNNNITLYS